MEASGGTLLVVDDDQDLRSLYQAWLRDAFDIRTAADGVEAMAAMDDEVDVVLLDREMPRKDGVAVARTLPRSAHDAAVVMVSGVEPGPDLLDIPVDDYLQKPVDREPLLAALRRGKALADGADRFQRLLSLDTRISIVESHATQDLSTNEAYQRTVADLEAELTAHEQTRPRMVTPSQGTAQPTESSERAVPRPRQ